MKYNIFAIVISSNSVQLLSVMCNFTLVKITNRFFSRDVIARVLTCTQRNPRYVYVVINFVRLPWFYDPCNLHEKRFRFLITSETFKT